MSASRTIFNASRSQMEENEDDYDSEDERYQRTQQRLLKKVEESASAIRALYEITRPFITGTWRLEREEMEEKLSQADSVSNLVPSKENEPNGPLMKASMEFITEENNDVDKPDSSRRKSIWSPVKHIKTVGVRSGLEMEKTPNWKPLRKSKARHSMASFSMENACRSSSLCDDDITEVCKPQVECDAPPKALAKVAEELRIPLKAVGGTNQALERRKSVSQSTCSSISECEILDAGNVDSETKSKQTSLRSENTPDSIEPCTSCCSQGPSSSVEDQEEVWTPSKPAHKLVKSFKSPVRCSPILRQAFGEEFSQVRGSIGSPDKVVNLDECTSPKDPSKVLKGVVAYVEVRRGADDRTGGFRWKLKQLGAAISDTLNKKVTHVIFQEGLLSTYRKAKVCGSKIVSPLWVMACDESFSKVPETRYPIESLSQYENPDPLQKCIKRPKIMSPDLGSGRDVKKLSRRLQHRSTKINIPVIKSPPKPLYIVKTPSPVKSLRFTLRSPISPKAKQKSEEIDDWDGYLAMVEAQVRERAKSRKEDETPVDFETRLQQLLGLGDEKGGNGKDDTPLASIFQRDKVLTSNLAPSRISPKNTKKIKPGIECSASSSLMMNWLQKRSPESASAAADEILKDLFKHCETPQKGRVTEKGNGIFSKSSLICGGTDTVANTSIVTKNLNENCREQVKKISMPFTAKLEEKGVVQGAKNPIKKNKFEFQGKEACSDAMRFWLSGVKSPPQTKTSTTVTNCSPVRTSLMTEGNFKKRKASSLDEIFLEETECRVKSIHAPKKHCPAITPEKIKSASGKQNISSRSTSKIALQNPSGVTPKKSVVDSTEYEKKVTARRRSLRLTPVKSTLMSGSVTQLLTLDERLESEYPNGENLTPRKQFANTPRRETPSKSSKKTATPRKSTLYDVK